MPTTPPFRPPAHHSAQPSAPPSPPRVRSRQLPATYRHLMSIPGFWRIALLGLASKLPAGMLSLSLLLLVVRHYSYGTAGLAVGGLAVGQSLTGPLRGRLVDRHSPRTVLLSCLGGHLAALALLLLAVYGRGAVLTVLALATLAGATAPPVAVMMRTVWHPLTGPRTLATAMALDSAMMGAALIAGPVLASWLSLSFSAAVPFLVVAVLSTCVVVRLGNVPLGQGSSRSSSTESGRRSGRLPSGRLPSGPLRRLLAANGLFVAAVTAVDVVLPMYAKEHGAAPYTGLYLATLSVGSVLGSLLLGAVPRLLSRRRQIPLLLCAFAVGTGVVAAASLLSPLAVLLLCPLAGLAIGSAFGALRTVGGELAPPGRSTETMSWLASFDTAGGAVGAAVFAQLADTGGSRTALGLVPLVVVLAGVIGWSVVRTGTATS
ncbi:MFS transporter [Streptomyces sp. NPDC021093]|uniref:MFS transporter n=1 Tax=Streptomyces sp. NPDC021093 TaxID=3365112 RepID=UPI00378EFA26